LIVKNFYEKYTVKYKIKKSDKLHDKLKEQSGFLFNIQICVLDQLNKQSTVRLWDRLVQNQINVRLDVRLEHHLKIYEV
jgi:hypothetical protein